MPQESGTNEARYALKYFDGLNATVQPSLAKRSELYHMENARSPQVGVLEKREGQTVKGTGAAGRRFVADRNDGLFKFINGAYQDIYRVSDSDEPITTFSTSVNDSLAVGDIVTDGVTQNTYSAHVEDSVSVTDPSFTGGAENQIRNDVGSVNIYGLTGNDIWEKLSDSDAQSIPGGVFDTATTEDGKVLVNQFSKNRLINKDGTAVLTSSDAGSLFNSPPAAKAAVYKGRIHLADFVYKGVRYPTTVVRSSFRLGIIALVNGDHSSGVGEIELTDTKYFYTDSGMNTYDIYRGGTLIETITVDGVNEESVSISGTTSNALNSSDEVWVSGTFEGDKQFRWRNNSTGQGRDVTLYNTFKLSGGDEDPLTMFEPVGNVLVMANKYNLATWDDYTLTNMDMNIGCSSDKGYTKLLGTLYFIHYSGIYSMTGESPTLISRKVERYINGATKSGLENAAAGHKGLSVFFTIGDVTLYKEDGSTEKTMPDVCLEYSIADENWYVHTNVPISEFVNFIADDGTEQLLGTHDGSGKPVMEFLKGNTDDGDEIFFRVDTQDLQLLEELETFVNPISILTEVQRGSQIQCFVSLDKADFYELNGYVQKGVSLVKVNSKDALKTTPIFTRRLKISYRDLSKQRCRISQTAIIYTPTTMDEPTE